MSLIKDLQNRRVFKMAGIYVAVAWGATEILVTVIDRLSMPEALGTVVVILFVLGFPVAMFLAWVFDVTPDGIRRTEPGTRKSAISIGLAFVFLITGTAGLYYFLDSRTQQRIIEDSALILPLRSIAVLPFESADADATSTTMALGIADELLIRLGAIPDLKVTGRASSFSEQLHGLDAKAIGQRLGVRNILQGSLRSTGEKLRISISLIDTISGYQVWTPPSPIDVDREDLYRVSADLATDVIDAMDINVSTEAMQRVQHSQKADPRAYDLYLMGLQRMRDQVGENSMLAVRYFEEALAIDPHFAKAHAGLSFALQSAALFMFVTPEQAMDKAREAALQAIALDPELVDGHDALANLNWNFYWDWASAIKNTNRSFALAPSNADVLAGYAYMLTFTGEFDAGVERMRQVAQLDPLTVDWQVQIGWVLQAATRFEEALAKYQEALSMIPDDAAHQLMRATVHMHRGLTYAAMGRREEAMEAAERSLRLANSQFFLTGGNAITFAWVGERERALQMLDEFHANADYSDPISDAYVYAALGDHERAIDYLEQMVDERSPSVIFLPQDHTIDALRDNPRFIALMDKTGLAPWSR